jgi:hypothetical protein
VFVGDHNLAPPGGVRPEPLDAWRALCGAGFVSVPFEGGGPAFTNMHELAKNAAGAKKRERAPMQFDHAFLARPPWLDGALARVVDIATRRYGHAAPDFIRLRAAAEELTDAHRPDRFRDPSLLQIATGFADTVRAKQKTTLKMFKRQLSDHRPVSVRLVWGGGGGGGGGNGGGDDAVGGAAAVTARKLFEK